MDDTGCSPNSQRNKTLIEKSSEMAVEIATSEARKVLRKAEELEVYLKAQKVKETREKEESTEGNNPNAGSSK